MKDCADMHGTALCADIIHLNSEAVASLTVVMRAFTRPIRGGEPCQMRVHLLPTLTEPDQLGELLRLSPSTALRYRNQGMPACDVVSTPILLT